MQTHRIITDYPQGYSSANYALIFLLLREMFSFTHNIAFFSYIIALNFKYFPFIVYSVTFHNNLELHNTVPLEITTSNIFV